MRAQGQATVELCLIAPLFMLALLLVLTGAQLAQGYQTAQAAARKGATALADAAMTDRSVSGFIDNNGGQDGFGSWLDANSDVEGTHSWKVKAERIASIWYQTREGDGIHGVEVQRVRYEVRCTVRVQAMIPLPGFQGGVVPVTATAAAVASADPSRPTFVD